jgi:hypothetical protein
MDKPIAEFKGEVFDKITVFPKIIRFTKKDWVFNLPRRDIRCLLCEPCNDMKCDFYINSKEYWNCILNIDKTFTLEEIGKMQGVSRQAINDCELNGRVKFRKRIKALNHARSLRDLLPDKPEFVVRERITK